MFAPPALVDGRGAWFCAPADRIDVKGVGIQGHTVMYWFAWCSGAWFCKGFLENRNVQECSDVDVGQGECTGEGRRE